MSGSHNFYSFDTSECLFNTLTLSKASNGELSHIIKTLPFIIHLLSMPFSTAVSNYLNLTLIKYFHDLEAEIRQYVRGR